MSVKKVNSFLYNKHDKTAKGIFEVYIYCSKTITIIAFETELCKCNDKLYSLLYSRETKFVLIV